MRPQIATRAKSLSRCDTSRNGWPPTFSNRPSTPFGVAAARSSLNDAAACDRRRRRSRAPSPRNRISPCRRRCRPRARPCAFASWPTTVPTAPVAAETTSVSPAFGAMIWLTPYQAVTPGMPSGPTKACSGTFEASTLRRSLAVGERIKLPAAVVRHDLVADREVACSSTRRLRRRCRRSSRRRCFWLRGVGLRFIHAPAHIGIERHPEILHEHLAIRRARRSPL